MATVSLREWTTLLAVAVAVSIGTSFLFRTPSSSSGDDELREQVAQLAARRAPAASHEVSSRALERRVAALEAEVASLRVRGDTTAPTSSGDRASAREPPEPWAALRESLSVDLATDSSSSEHAMAIARVAEHLVSCAGPPRDETEFAWATRALLREAARDRISAEEAARLEPVLHALPAGHAARRPLAQAVAIGWSSDTRMNDFLSHFATNSEPTLHQGVLAILDDEHPSDAYSEYVIRIIREEREPAVLGIALGLDRIEAAATATVAPRLVDVIARRIAGGDLDVEMRARAGLAISVASLRAPDLGVTTLRGLADRETDAELQVLLRRAAEQFATGDATLKSLERLFD